MLRAKQISNLSHSARSFFLNGPRCSATDGSSCTCSEDEICVSKQSHSRKEVLVTPNHPASVSKTPVKIGTLISENAAKVVVSQKAEVIDQPTSLKQILKTPTSLAKSDCVSYAKIETVQKDMGQSSAAITDQLVKAGVVAVNFFSDLVNYKVPAMAGSGIFNSPQNCMVDPNRPLTKVKSSHVKQIKRENFSAIHHPKSSSEVAVDSIPRSNNYHGSKGNYDKSGYVEGLKQIQCNGGGKSSDAHDKRNFPQSSKAHSTRFTPNFNSNTHFADAEFAFVAKSFNKMPRVVEIPTGFSPINRQNVVESVSHILRQFKWGTATEEALTKLNFYMDPYQANQILKQLEDHSIALGFFNWLKRQKGFKHDGHTYTTMVGILGRAKQFSAIKKLIDQMIMDGCKPNVVTYNRLIHSYGRANYLKDAVNVFNQMKELGVEPDRVTYCTLIDIHAKAGFLDTAMYMYGKMQEAGLTPDTFTYSVMINCLGKSGNLNAAHRLFCTMIDRGCIPSLVTYNIMTALHAKARNYEIALKLYREMQNAGFVPDKVTYSIIMEVLGHCGYLEEAEALFLGMLQNNWVPDEPIYGLLVDLWGKSGNIEKAREWYHAMLNAGLRPNVPTCNSLLSAYLRVNRLSDAYNLLRTMVSLGLNPSLQTYTLLLSSCTDAQASNNMGFCCELLATTNHPAHNFLLSMPSAGPDGKNVRDHMCVFLDLMHSEDRESKRGLVDAVVDFLYKSGLKEEAGSVWEAVVQKNVYPEAIKEKSSCYWLINLHDMSDGTAVTALSRTLAWFRRQMLISGVGPSRIDIVTGWGRRSRVTGTSMVRQAVQELLNIFRFPFFTEHGNSGCFVGCGESLSRWLAQSHVERMHLL